MNNLSSKQRKLIYFAVIVVLATPIIFLGAPSSGQDGQSGGKLAQLRFQEELGESTLGKVDPSSSTMNLVLLGFRGIAASQLWAQANEQKDQKDWAGLRATTESIIMLQPHFQAVWEFNAWNLAFNVSAECDDVKDRFYWVKEGIKFLQGGAERNRKIAELRWHMADYHGKKIGRSDEWRQFRRFYRIDPDRERYEGQPDPAINPENIDNYLHAQQIFYEANEVEETSGQHLMQRLLFRSYPARSQFDYAAALHRENKINEESRLAWDKAYQIWTKEFGREEFQTPKGGIVLEFTDEDLTRLAERDHVSKEDKRFWTASYQDRCQYRYWRTVAAAEGLKLTRDAHRSINDGKRLFREANFVQSDEDKAAGKGPETWGALEYLLDGMTKYERVLRDFPSLKTEDEAVEQVMLAVLYMQNIYELRDMPVPDDFPLKDVWEKNQPRLAEMESLFARELRNQ